VGATSADTQREIEEIRFDISSAADELERRALRLVDVQAHARWLQENPAALAGVGLVVVGVCGVLAFRAVSSARKRRRPDERLKRTVLGAAEELGERLERAREAIPLDVHIGSHDHEDDPGRGPDREGSNAGMVKKMLWAALAASMMAAAGLVARRLSAVVWKAAMKEEPPTASV